MVKIELNTKFWEEHNQNKTSKMFTIIGIFIVINLLYSAVTDGNNFLIINFIPFGIIIIMHLSYIKWQKKQEDGY